MKSFSSSSKVIAIWLEAWKVQNEHKIYMTRYWLKYNLPSGTGGNAENGTDVCPVKQQQNLLSYDITIFYWQVVLNACWQIKFQYHLEVLSKFVGPVGQSDIFYECLTKNVGVPDKMSDRKWWKEEKLKWPYRTTIRFYVSHLAVFVGTRSTLNFRRSTFFL